MKKILVIVGGGRPRGTLPNWWTRLSAEHRRLGTRWEKVSLLQTEVKGCLGCNACRYGKPCVQKDGFQGVADKILAADLIAFASPLYFLDHILPVEGT